MSVVIRIISLVGLYFFMGQAAWLISVPPSYASVFWPSAGVALGFVYLYGYRMLPGVFIGTFLISVFSPAQQGFDLNAFTMACSLSVGGTLQAFVGAYFLRRYIGENTQLQKLRSIIVFSVIGVLTCVISASVATATFYVGGIEPLRGLSKFWEPWFIGDFLGVLIVTPLLILTLNPVVVSRRRQLAVIVPALLLLVLVVTLFLNVKRADTKSRMMEFQGSVGLLHREIIDEFNIHLNEMASLRSFYDASSYVDREEFEKFISNSFQQGEGIQAFGWAPYIPGEELPLFLGTARQLYDSSYEIKTWSPDVGFTEIQRQDSYLPVLYVFPHEKNKGILGFDLQSESVRREAIEKSRVAKGVMASAPLQLIESESPNTLGFLLFDPIVGEQDDIHKNGFGEQKFTGVIIGAFQYAATINPVISLWEDDHGIELHLKTARGDENKIVYQTHKDEHQGDHIDGFMYEKEFEYAGQTWLFCYYINPDFYHDNVHFILWYGLIAGLMFVYFAIVFLLSQTGQAARMEELIEAKTKELSYKNRFLNIVMDSVPDMVFVKDKDFNIFQANQAFLEKYDPEIRDELIGSTGLEQHPQDEQDIYLLNDKKAMEEGFSEVEETNTDYLGVTRTLITRKLRFHDEEGQPFLFAYARDVTDFLSAQRKLEAILDSTADGLITISEKGIVETYNKTCEEIFGYKAEEVIGSNIKMLMPEQEAGEHDSYLSDYLKTGKKKVIGNRLEMNGRRKDGTLFPIDISVAEVRLGGRRIFSGVLRDISERKRVEELSQQIAQIFNNATIEFYIFDAETFEFVFVNEGAIQNMGYSQEELIGHRPSEFVPAYKSDQFYAMAATLASGEVDHLEFDMRHVRKDGSTYDVVANIQVTKFDGKPAFIASMLDMTERNKVLDELKRSNKELENFAYVTSHDLKAPLRHVSMSAGFFKEKFGDQMDEKSQELLDVMLSGTDRMQNMMESLLEYSRVGRDDTKWEPVDLNDIMLAVKQNLEGEISSANAVVQNEALPIIHADRYLMIQLFQNLIQNSMKYRDETVSPRVNISAEDKRDRIIVSVADNGIGIEPEYADKIFQIFQRLHRDNEYDGVGIGLSICQRIVEFHGGSIHLDEKYSGGTRIIFTLLKNKH